MESENVKFTEIESRMLGVWEKWEDADQRVQISSYKQISLGDLVYNIVTTVINTGGSSIRHKYCYHILESC